MFRVARRSLRRGVVSNRQSVTALWRRHASTWSEKNQLSHVPVFSNALSQLYVSHIEADFEQFKAEYEKPISELWTKSAAEREAVEQRLRNIELRYMRHRRKQLRDLYQQKAGKHPNDERIEEIEAILQPIVDGEWEQNEALVEEYLEKMAEAVSGDNSTLSEAEKASKLAQLMESAPPRLEQWAARPPLAHAVRDHDELERVAEPDAPQLDQQLLADLHQAGINDSGPIASSSSSAVVEGDTPVNDNAAATDAAANNNIDATSSTTTTTTTATTSQQLAEAEDLLHHPKPSIPNTVEAAMPEPKNAIQFITTKHPWRHTPNASDFDTQQLTFKERRVTLKVDLDAFQMTKLVRERFIALAGIRFDSETNIFKMSMDSYPTQKDNKRALIVTLKDLLTQAYQADSNFVPASGDATTAVQRHEDEWVSLLDEMGGGELASDRVRLGPALAPATFARLVQDELEHEATQRTPHHGAAQPLVVQAPRDHDTASALATKLRRPTDASTLRWFRFDRMPSTQTINAESDACSKLMQETAAFAN